MLKNTKRVAVLAAVTAGTLSAGIAYASWAATGSAAAAGSQAAAHSKAKQLLTVTTTAPADMYPTQSAPGNVVGTVTNPNPYNVTLTSASVSAVSGPAACAVALTDFTFGTAVMTTALATKNSGTPGVVTIPITAVNNSLPDGCDNADLKFDVTVGGGSS